MELKIKVRETFLLLLPFSLLALSILSGCSNGKAGKTGSVGASDAEKALGVKVVIAESRQVRRTVEAVGGRVRGGRSPGGGFVLDGGQPAAGPLGDSYERSGVHG